MRASTFFWSSVCGMGMCSPFDTICVGIGEWNRFAASARVSCSSCSSLSQTSASRSPRIVMTLPPISGHRGLYGLRRRPQKETTTRMRMQRAEAAFAVDGPLPRWNYFTTLALPTCDFNRNCVAVRSGHLDRLAHRAARAGVIHPGKFELAAVERHGVELQERIGGDAGRHLGAEHLDAVVAARKRADHVLRHLAPIDLEPVAGLHRVLDQDAHPDDLAAPRLARQLDARGHQLPSSSTHADRVTTTLALSIQNEPSDISASATTRWLPASRTREAISAAPARGPRWKLAIRASGLRSEIRWIARTWSASLIGLSTLTLIDTELPLSASSGISSFTRPCLTGAPCVMGSSNGSARAPNASPDRTMRKLRRLTRSRSRGS